MEEGDSNSKFFLDYASTKRNGNWIKHVKYGNKAYVEDQEGIELVFLTLFKHKWKNSYCNLSDRSDVYNK